MQLGMRMYCPRWNRSWCWLVSSKRSSRSKCQRERRNLVPHRLAISISHNIELIRPWPQSTARTWLNVVCFNRTVIEREASPNNSKMYFQIISQSQLRQFSVSCTCNSDYCKPSSHKIEWQVHQKIICNAEKMHK